MGNYIEALKIERDQYLRRGLKDRVKMIDDILKKHDEQIEVESASIEPEAERAIVRKARKRKA